MRAWVYLLVAIFFEVIGTSSIKLLVHDFPLIGYGVMYCLIGLSYFFLSLSVKKVPVGVAYALWEGIGIVLITMVSVALFNEQLGLFKIGGLGLIIVGILLIKSGTQSVTKKVNNYQAREA